MSETSEVLRRAAGLMRERAEAASVGPWKRFGMAGVAGKEWEIVDERRVECECGEPVALLGCATNQDAEHIASWHPAVALAVADWLEVEADRIDDNLATYRPDQTRYDSADAWVERNHRQGLAVARAYLGADQ